MIMEMRLFRPEQLYRYRDLGARQNTIPEGYRSSILVIRQHASISRRRRIIARLRRRLFSTNLWVSSARAVLCNGALWLHCLRMGIPGPITEWAMDVTAWTPL